MKIITALLNAGAFGTALLFAATGANATIIADNTVSSASGIEGVKNAPGNSYSQGFQVLSADAGDVDSIIMDLSVKATSKDVFPTVSNPATMSVYLYAANSSGVPTGASPLDTLATGITISSIKGGTDLGYSTGGGNNFEIYQDTLSFSSYDLTAGDYAILIEITNGGSDNGQSVGWGETSSSPSGDNLLGQTQNDPDGTDPYATLELLTIAADPAPDASSTVSDQPATV